VDLQRKAQLLQIIEGYEPKDVYIAIENGLYIRLPHYKALVCMLYWKELQVGKDSSVSLQSQLDKLHHWLFGRVKNLIAPKMSENYPLNT